jgi:hypothetical protein
MTMVMNHGVAIGKSRKVECPEESGLTCKGATETHMIDNGTIREGRERETIHKGENLIMRQGARA